jgi:rRNA-processing protein FCF1
VPDDHIYVAANPDSLYLFRKEWEAELYDYKKTLNSFNFTKCNHGKNVADDILLGHLKTLDLKSVNVYLLSFDRELKERFNEACHKSCNLYILEK